MNVAPIYKIRAALRERAESRARPASSPFFGPASQRFPISSIGETATAHRAPVTATAPVESIVDHLMLQWTDAEVALRHRTRDHVAAACRELTDLRALVTACLTRPPAQVATLERLLVFTKLESAHNLARRAAESLACLAVATVLWFSVSADPSDDQAATRAPRSVRIVRTIRNGKRRHSSESLDSCLHV
jgi:hypothetical protein